MRKILVAFLFLPAAALAQNNRSAVSINGNDANPCTPSAPCRSFSAALNQTNAGGEIIAIDSAGYGPFTIDRWVTVAGAPGVHAAISVTSGIGINVTAPSPVTIRNLVLIGNGGAIGILSASSTSLRVLNCVVRGFTAAGIAADGTAVIDHTAVIDNVSATGILFTNSALTPVRHPVVTGSTIQGNGNGVLAREQTAAVVKDSVITGNLIGVNVFCGGNTAVAEITLENCAIAHNGAAGVQGDAGGNQTLAIVNLSQNVIAYNPLGVVAGAAFVYSFNNNRFVGNGADGGPFGSLAFE